MNQHPKSKGDVSVAAILSALLKKGKKVLLPFGDNLRYDIAIDEKGKLVRVQVKTGRVFKGGIRFPTASTYAHVGGKRRGYHGEADFFGVYVPALDKTYLIPVSELGKNESCLRLDPLKSHGRTARWAKDYEL